MEVEDAERELTKLLLESIYPLMDEAHDNGEDALTGKLRECADAVAQLCEFERWRPKSPPAAQVARLVEQRQQFWSQADLAVQELIRDLAQMRVEG